MKKLTKLYVCGVRLIPHKLSSLSIAIAGIVFFLSVFGQVEKTINPVDKEIEDERIELLESKSGFVKDVPLGGGAHLDFLSENRLTLRSRFVTSVKESLLVEEIFYWSERLFLRLEKVIV